MLACLLGIALSTSDAAAGDHGRADPAPRSCATDAASASGVQPAALTPEERSRLLEQALSEELARFDALLLHERNAIAERQTREGGGAGGGSAAGAGGTEGTGEGEGSSGGSAGAARDGEAAAEARGSGERKPERGRERDSEGNAEPGQGETAQAGGRAGEREGQTGASETTAAALPSDIGDGRDDDIVARQIREAALAEPDPQLRDKLWQEYRDYKASVRARGASSTRATEDR